MKEGLFEALKKCLNEECSIGNTITKEFLNDELFKITAILDTIKEYYETNEPHARNTIGCYEHVSEDIGGLNYE